MLVSSRVLGSSIFGVLLNRHCLQVLPHTFVVHKGTQISSHSAYYSCFDSRTYKAFTPTSLTAFLTFPQNILGDDNKSTGDFSTFL